MMRTISSTTLVAALAAALLPAPAAAQADEPWKFGASLYGWFPDIEGRTRFADATGRGDFEVGIDKIVNNLEFTFQGNFDARRGQYGLFADVVYMSVGKARTDTRDATVGGVQIPVGATASTEFDMKSWIWTFAGYYRAIESSDVTLDVVGGLRYIDVTQTLDWNVSGNVGSIPIAARSGRGSVGIAYWDAIVGLRGRFALTQDHAWFMPWYLDIGTGNSDFTWQAMAGVGYRFRWGEAIAAYRYLAYDMPSDSRLADVNLSGPLIGATFRW
jgi:hypothetical protein